MLNFWRQIDRYDKLAFLLGLLLNVKFRIVGVFSVSEIILLAMCVFSGVFCYKENKYVKRLVFFTVLWIIGTIISNVHNDIVRLDFIKGVFFLVVLLFIIPPIYKIIHEKPERLILYFLGYGISNLFARYTAADEMMSESLSANVYVYYSVAAFVYGICYFLYFKGRKKIAIYLCYATAIAGLFNMARNPFLTWTISTMLILYVERKSLGSDGSSISFFKKKIPVLIFVALGSGLLADFAYGYFAARGTLGYEAQDKYYKQKMAGGNMLEGGRSETFMGIELIKRNPIWGYGSYAKDVNDAFHAEYAAINNLEYRYSRTDDRYLPGHSHIVGAWLQNGILGGLFWMYVVVVLWKFFRSGCMLHERRMLLLIIAQLVALLWNILFSPFGDRVSTMFFVITLFCILDHYQKGYYDTNSIENLNL